MSSTGKYINVYDKSDMVQRLGGIDNKKESKFLIDLPPQRSQQYNNKANMNVEVNPKNDIDFIYFTHTIPAYLYDEFFKDHTNLDSKEIWEKIKNEKSK